MKMRPNQSWIVGVEQPVLVTGANGFIGARVVKTLLDYGFRRIRCFVRSTGSLARLHDVVRSHPAGEGVVDIIEGNLLSTADCDRAAIGAVIVFHLAAGIDKSFAGCFMNSVLATRNLLDASVKARVLKRFVNVSSFAVYSNYSMRADSRFDEATPLEASPTERHDPYGYAKLKQEELVAEYHRRFGVPYVTLRPGAVFGPGKKTLTGRVGIDTFGVFLHIGGSNPLPATFVDNCAEAIVLAGLVAGVDGQVFNVVDDELPASKQMLKLFKQSTGGFYSVRLPYFAAYGLSAFWEWYAERSKGQLLPHFNRRRASAEWKRHRYSNDKLKTRLGWRPKVSFAEAASLWGESLRIRQ